VLSEAVLDGKTVWAVPTLYKLVNRLIELRSSGPIYYFFKNVLKRFGMLYALICQVTDPTEEFPSSFFNGIPKEQWRTSRIAKNEFVVAKNKLHLMRWALSVQRGMLSDEDPRYSNEKCLYDRYNNHQISDLNRDLLEMLRRRMPADVSDIPEYLAKEVDNIKNLLSSCNSEELVKEFADVLNG
jgi:hypothetical protein